MVGAARSRMDPRSPQTRSTTMASPTSHPRNRDEDKVSNPSQFGTDIRHKTQETGAVLTEKTKDAVSAVADTVGQKARDVASGVGQTASSLGHKAEETTSAVGSRMQSLAGTIREKGPQDGIMGTATSSL